MCVCVCGNVFKILNVFNIVLLLDDREIRLTYDNVKFETWYIYKKKKYLKLMKLVLICGYEKTINEFLVGLNFERLLDSTSLTKRNSSQSGYKICR